MNHLNTTNVVYHLKKYHEDYEITKSCSPTIFTEESWVIIKDLNVLLFLEWTNVLSGMKCNNA